MHGDVDARDAGAGLAGLGGAARRAGLGRARRAGAARELLVLLRRGSRRGQGKSTGKPAMEFTPESELNALELDDAPESEELLALDSLPPASETTVPDSLPFCFAASQKIGSSNFIWEGALSC